jgi:hypothetical protein
MGYHLATEAKRYNLNGLFKDNDDFARSVISYMKMIAEQKEAASKMHSCIN